MNRAIRKWISSLGCFLLLSTVATAGTSIEVVPLSAAPQLDGMITEWDSLTPSPWHSLTTKLASMDEKEEPNQERGDGWTPELKAAAGVHQDHFYLAVQWRDSSNNAIYKPWKRQGVKYTRSNRKDDMFAARFQLSDNFDVCMLSGKDYEVDLWLWSAGRSSLAGIADDMLHRYATKPLDPAMEYDTSQGVVYIQKSMDAGNGGWAFIKPPASAGNEMAPSVVVQGVPGGSRGDVAAFGRWDNGTWTLELRRKLKTDDLNDVVFSPGGKTIVQFAVFNAEYHIIKQVTAKLTLNFSMIP